MRSNLCSFAGLLPVLLLAATLGSFGYDMPEEATRCRLGSQCKNQDKLAVAPSRRTLSARRLSLGDSSLLHFAKRRPPMIIGAAYGQNYANGPLPSTVLSDPDGSMVVSASAAPPTETSLLDPVVSPSPLNFIFPEDCHQECPDGYTYTPPGAPSCGCVIPMHAQFRLGIKLEKLFPLVSELASELADGLFLKTSQVRIVGANADESNQDMTDVSAYLVPLASKFDDTTAHLLASRLWSGQVPLNKSFFGSFVSIFVTYPGLPPSPPAQFPGSNVSPPGPANQLPPRANAQDKDNQFSSGLITMIALASAWVCCCSLVLCGSFSYAAA